MNLLFDTVLLGLPEFSDLAPPPLDESSQVGFYPALLEVFKAAYLDRLER